MKVLQVHNFYQQAGGEDQVVAAEHALLSSHGHTVLQYTVHNDAVTQIPPASVAVKTIWNSETYRNIQRLVQNERVDLLHVHNTLPLVSPSVYSAAAAQNVPVIQTLHNYRFLCPAATLYREGQICELCLPKTIKLPAMEHRCYRNSFAASAAVSGMLAVHGFRGTYQRKVQTYIALTEFARAKFCEGGLPPKRITVKPNFIAADPGIGQGSGGYALFAGRLTEEKGLAILLDAWSQNPQAPMLKIAGDGPLQSYVREKSATLLNVEYLGPCNHSRVLELLKDALFLAFPSRWYEGMPMVILESMACGTPVVAFSLGSMRDLVLENQNGIALPPQDPLALSGFLQNWVQFASVLTALRRAARAHFEAHFTAEKNYGLLLNIYQQALNRGCSIS